MNESIKIDSEFKELIPALSQEEFNQLEQNILSEGCRDPLVLWNDTLIDGHNRYEICKKCQLQFTIKRFTDIDFKTKHDVKKWIINNQFGRRNISAYTRSKLALELKEVYAKEAKERQLKGKKTNDDLVQNSVQGQEPKKTVEKIAKRAEVSRDTIAKVEKIEKAKEEGKIDEKTYKDLQTGDTSINKVFTDLKKEEKKQEFKEIIEKQKQDIEKENIEKPSDLFDVIVIDPPWNYGRQYDPDTSRVANPYPEMKQEELKQLYIPAKENCVMFLWTTHQFIWNAKELLEHWNFDYKYMLVWDKEKMGMGSNVRMQCEFCLVAFKGNPFYNRDNCKSIRDIIKEPRKEHSRKPGAFYEIVEKLTTGNKIDMFARQERKDWTVYGNETNKFMGGVKAS